MLAQKLTDDLNGLREWIRVLEQRLEKPVAVADTSEEEYVKKKREYQVGVGTVLPLFPLPPPLPTTCWLQTVLASWFLVCWALPPGGHFRDGIFFYGLVAIFN